MTRPRFRSWREAEAYLLGFVNYETRSRYRATTRTHDLEGFRARLVRAGWDPRAVPTVHVGGTNGKGTVATLLERVLRAGGLSTGLYTSPHLHVMRERIRLDGRPVGAGDFRDGVARLAEAFAAEPRAGFRTTFEHLTALALLLFQEHGVERGVLEVGLGGRLDATNVIPAGPVVLTPVSLDHARVLGRTVGRIAADKAHILKPGGAAFVMPQTSTAMAAIRRRAETVGAPMIETSGAVEVVTLRADARGTTLRVRGRTDHGEIRTRLLGRHQEANVAAVVAVAEALLPRREAAPAVRAGLAGALVPGRLELLRHGGRVHLLDGGHNPGAARTLAAALRRHFPGAEIAAVVGMARDKAHRSYLSPLEGVVKRFVFTAADNPRAATPRALARCVRSPFRCVSTVPRALESAARTSADLVLVCGSFILVGEAREALGRRHC